MHAHPTVRSITDDEVDRFRTVLNGVFAQDMATDPHGGDRFRALVDRSRTYCGYDGDRMVATAATFDLGLAVPGGATVPMGGLTMVTVQPTHRRRGFLRAMVGAHLEDVRARGEPLSGLWASEGPIYGRFGYGVAAEGHELTLAGGTEVAAGWTCDQVAQVEDAEAARVLPGVYARAQAGRPGMFTRSAPWWQHRRFTDRPDGKGRSPRVHVVASRAGTATGYVVFRQQLAFTDGAAAGALEIEELVAIDAQAEATLWRFLAGVDLFPKVSWWNAPVDTLLPWLAADPRAAVRRRRADTLWLRVCNVPEALRARAYAADGVLRFAVADPADPAPPASWSLTVEGGAVRCEPTDAAPELRLDVGALASVYLGAVAPSLLARAGRIQGDGKALARADRMFTWPVAPWCPEIF